jgi:vancomycin resistance protein YoaR
MAIGFSLTLLAGVLLMAGISAAIGMSAGAAIHAGVEVGGISLAGLERTAARERLAAELPSLADGRAVATIDGVEHAVTFAELGHAYDLDAMVDAALAVGRGGSPLTDGVARLRTLAHSTSLPVLVHPYEAAALDAAATTIARSASSYPVEAAVTRTGTELTLHRSANGRTVDPGLVASVLGTALATTEPGDVAVRLASAPVEPIVDTAEANRAAAAAESMMRDLRLGVPGSDDALTLTADEIAGWLTFGPQESDDYVARLDRSALASAVTARAAEVDHDPVNARIAVAAGGGLGGVVPAQDGREMIVDESITRVTEALRARARGASIPSLALAVRVTEPTLTTAEVEAIRPQMRLVSSWTTYYVPGDGNGWGNNINIPARDIDGRNLAPGEWFSFWGGIGPVTVERGFMYGGVIIGGRSVAGGAIGGGICSTSTTLFNAALRAGLEMGIRANHYYYIPRYPDGLDATVYMADGYVQDMTFRNDTEHPIVIRGFGGNGFVTFQLWTVPLNRTVVITDAVTSNFRRAVETTQVTSALAPGTAKRVEYPHDGHDVVRTRFVYAADGSLLHQDRYFSSYRTVNGITLVGPRPATPPPPPPSEGDTGGTGDAPPPSPPPGG